MATIDMTQRKIQFPPRFLPYLEKHRIFELFHECLELLLQVRPKDHIQFLKNILPCATMRKDKQRIVFLAPPFFDREKFTDLIADCLGIQGINRMYLDLLTRERKLSEELKLKKEEQLEEEEISCICPAGEGEGEISYPLYIPGEAGEESTIKYPPFFEEPKEKMEEEEEEAPEETIEEEEVMEEEVPCICVCPCVKKLEEERGEVPLKDRCKDNENKKEESELETIQEIVVSISGETLGSRSMSAGEGEGEMSTIKEVGEFKTSKREKEPEMVEGFDYQKRNSSVDNETADEWEGEAYDLPCESIIKKKKHRKWIPQAITPTESSESIEIDYGLLAECELAARGWILEDFPSSGEEALKLNALGVLPTHALRIIVDEEAEAEDREYKWLVHAWMKAYKFVPVVEIRMGQRTLDKLASNLCKFLKVMPHRHAPMLPRVVLIGSRGAGVTTQGQKLAQKYGMVHVEFEIVKARALQQEDYFAKLYKRQLFNRPDPELEAFILEKVLLTSACRNRGWVLTGYPKNIDQMRMLDIIATPPNRIIFINVPPKECFIRLFYRKIDPCLGDEYKLPKIQPEGLESFDYSNIEPEIASRLLSHPRNEKKVIVHDIENYFFEKQAMIDYCGGTASFVNGDKTVDSVFEHIEQILINPAPAHPPRDPYGINIGLEESVERLKKYRLASGMFFNNLFLNPPEHVIRF